MFFTVPPLLTTDHCGLLGINHLTLRARNAINHAFLSPPAEKKLKLKQKTQEKTAKVKHFISFLLTNIFKNREI